MKTVLFPNRLRQFRWSQHISQAALARKLGVSKVTVVRWENGSAKPSPLAAEKLRSVGFGRTEPHETNLVETPLIKLRAEHPLFRAAGLEYPGNDLAEEGEFKIKRNGRLFNLKPASYVLNGPPNQVPFFKRLFELQATCFDRGQYGDTDAWVHRLSAVEKVEGYDAAPCQNLLEAPRKGAAHWNPNYGSHGWHRYVGRFPPHLVRALLNSFGASSGSVVCDPFAGSGTTLVECRLLGIPAIGIEICPLSALISRVKSQFPDKTDEIDTMAKEYARFYSNEWSSFAGARNVDEIAHLEIACRPGNPVEPFPNYERWLTGRAFLGISITLQYASKLNGYLQDVLLVALSARMRSIGNVDVDVVRAEYRRTPRQNVQVAEHVLAALGRVTDRIRASVSTHSDLIGSPDSIQVIDDDVRNVALPNGSIDHVITSPPYGVEASSYLRTHLLSYRCLKPFLHEDPYEFGNRVIGSEYVSDSKRTHPNEAVGHISPSFVTFFSKCLSKGSGDKITRRAHMMMQFFDDMHMFALKLQRWTKPNGNVALVIGNKRVGPHIVPTKTIVEEIFSGCGFVLSEEIAHKLKCNNTNSQVPWQERVIQDEYVLLFSKGSGV